MILTLDFRPGFLGRFRPAVKTPRVYGATLSGDKAISALLAATDGRRVLVVIHGYNSPDAAVDPAYDAMVHQLGMHGLYDPQRESTAYDAILLVKWPGGWKGGYHLAEARAYGALGMPGAGDRLRDVLMQLDPLSLDIQAHSLGNGVALAALRDQRLIVRHWIAAAAAVDNDHISRGGPYFEAVSRLFGTALIFHSQHDSALRAFSVAKWDRALGYTGPVGEAPKNVRLVDANCWSSNHSAFRDRPEFYAAWLRLVSG